MDVELTLNEVYAARQGLFDIGQMKMKAKLAYAVARNTRAIMGVLQDIEEAKKLPKEILDSEPFRAYEKQRQAFAKQLARKDGNGNPIEKNGQWDITDKLELVNRLDEWLEENAPELKKELKEHEDSVNSLQEATFEVNIHKMQLTDFPDEFEPYRLGIVVDWIEDDHPQSRKIEPVK